MVSYGVLFLRQVDGCHVGDYIGLDFAHFIALSRIDRRLRSALREITRRLRLRNLRVAQVASALYMLSELCTNPSTRARHAGAKTSVKTHYGSCACLFRANDGVVSSFDFLWKRR